jgi:hypothetical protein
MASRVGAALAIFFASSQTYLKKKSAINYEFFLSKNI